MKTSPAALLATLTLSLALGACDSGDKMDSGSAAPKLPPKAPKEAAAAPEGGAPASPAAPVNNATPPPMPTGAGAVSDSSGVLMPDLERINGAIKLYNQKRSVELMTQMGPATGKVGDLNAQKQKYLANAGKSKAAGTGAGLTSLDDLVKAGLLKSLPEAPAGKKFVFDVKTQEARLENK